MRRLLLLASVLLFVAVACAPSAQEIADDNYSWCYTFDFTSGGNFGYEDPPPSLAVFFGQLNASGLQSNNGRLAFNYLHTQLVYPSLITADVTFTSSNGESSYIIASVEAFGIDQYVESYISNESGSIAIDAFAGANGNSATISVTTDNTKTVLLTAVTVYGYGVNPFPVNSCAGGGGGGSVTNTPISIPTATATATATYTPSPTGTQEPLACFYTLIFDFTIADGGWYPNVWGSYVAGVGFVGDNNTENRRIWSIRYGFTTPHDVLSMSVNYNFGGTLIDGTGEESIAHSLRAGSSNVANVQYMPTYYGVSGATTITTDFTSYSYTGIDIVQFGGNANASNNDIIITGATLDVYGVSDVCDSNLTSTPTPFPTSTPSATPTPNETENAQATAEMALTLTAMPECVYQEYRDFRESTNGFSIVNGKGTWASGEGWRSVTVDVNGDDLQQVIIYTDLPGSIVYDIIYVIHFPSGMIGNPTAGANQISVQGTHGTNTWDYPDGFDPAIINAPQEINGQATYQIILSASATSFDVITDPFGNPTVIQQPFYVRGVYITQFGQSPDCEPPPATATYTPTPDKTQVAATSTKEYEDQLTATYTPTPTIAEACLFQNYSFNDGLSQWSYSGASAYPGAVILNNGAYIEQTVYSDGGYYLWVPATVNDGAGDDTDGSATIYYQIKRFSDNAVIAGGTITTTEQSFYAGGGNLYNFISEYIPMTAGFYTIQIQAQLASISTINALSACFTLVPPEQVIDDTEYPDDNFSWAECGDTISPPANLLNIGSWIRYLWSQLTKFFICSLEPILNGIFNAISALFELIGWLVGWLWQFLQNAWGFLWWILTSAWDLIVSVLGMLWDLILYLVDQIWRVISWALTALSQLFTLYELWRDVEPVQPPGLPDCINSPTDSNICAVYYIAEHTFFSGTIGGLFIPVLLVYISLEMVSWVITRIIAIFGQTISTLIGDE